MSLPGCFSSVNPLIGERCLGRVPSSHQAHTVIMVYVAANAWYRWTMHVCRQIIVSITVEAQPILSMNLTTKTLQENASCFVFHEWLPIRSRTQY